MIDRKIGIGGSDCYTLWHGSDKDWNKLWAIKTGQEEPEDLSNSFKVQLGIYTEKFNLICLREKLASENKRTNKGIHIQSQLDLQHGGHKQKKLDDIILYAHLDGYIFEQGGIIVECKHTYQDNTLENLVRCYNPQMQHYMNVYNCNKAIMSGIFGNRAHMFEVIERDQKFIDKLETVQKTFWNFVKTNKQPFDIKD